MSGRTYRAVADARAALAALDVTARALHNPQLFRRTTLRLEAQSTAALEGTYEPLARVLSADEDEERGDDSLREVMNYLHVAETAFGWSADRATITVSRLAALQGLLMAGTAHETSSGQVRATQVAIGRRQDAPVGALRVHAARFVPPPPGPDLAARLGDVLRWMHVTPNNFDPVVAAAMGHYAFEALHPFADGNGRLGRLLIVLQLMAAGVLTEPTLSVSPWFEARRADYFDHLLHVSTDGDWDSYTEFFARGLAESANQTSNRMRQLSTVQADLKAEIASSRLRAGAALQLVDLAVEMPTFSVNQAAEAVGLTYSGASRAVESLVELGVLGRWGKDDYSRRFCAPAVIAVLIPELAS